MPYGPARSFTGGWWLLMTHQLSLEQSGTSSASLGPPTAGNGAPPGGIMAPNPTARHAPIG